MRAWRSSLRPLKNPVKNKHNRKGNKEQRSGEDKQPQDREFQVIPLSVWIVLVVEHQPKDTTAASGRLFYEATTWQAYSYP